MAASIRTLTVSLGTAMLLAIATNHAAALTTDAPMVGDWSCGADLRVYITRFGSIEILGGEPPYRAGLIDVEADIMTVTWDEGRQTEVAWTLGEATLTLDGLADGEPMSCTPRP